MKLWYVICIASLIGLLVLHTVDQRHHDSELADVRSKVRTLSMSPDAPRIVGEARRAVAAGPAPTPLVPKETSEAPEPGANAASAQALEVSDVRDQLERSFTKQDPDLRWSGEARRTAEIRLSAILHGTSKLRSLECRTSMCRIETVHVGLESYRQFVLDAFMSSETKLWNGGFFSTRATDPVNGEIVTVSYLAREGEELPLVAEL